MAQGQVRYNIPAGGMEGSAAFDLYRFPGNTAPEEAGRTAAEEREAEIERARRRERARAHNEAVARAKENQAVSVAAVAGFAVTAVLLVMVLFSYIRLTELNTEISRLKNTVADLTLVQTKLDVEYERTFNLNAVKDYATSTLGMTKLTDLNSVHFTMERADKAVILAKDDSAGLGVLTAARDFLSSLAEYLR